MIEMTLAEVAEVTGGTLHDADPAIRITGGVEFDSRRVGAGDLFVAFVGNHVDGHDFADSARSAGAVAVLGTRALTGVPMVVVDDPLSALAKLARRLLAQLTDTLTVIGVTGSSGKTTTKDLLGQLVGRLGPTVAPAGSFNNELGLPYTVLRADSHTRYLVLEKAARGLGHIEYLCRIAPPDLGVVLNVGTAHVGEFGSVEAIASAKSELVRALPEAGVAVLNADDPHVAAMATATDARVLWYGESERADVRAVDVRLDARGRPGYRLVTADGQAPVQLGLTGLHQVSNTLAVAAVGVTLGMSVDQVAEALGDLRTVSPRRMDVFDRPDRITVIDDSYNANPTSTAAALRALASIGRGRRTVAVLGYLAELGEFERDGHAQVGALAAELGVDHLVVVEELAAPIHSGADGARARTGWKGESVLVADQDAAIGWLRERLHPGDVVLVKGSRYRTWQVADWLRQDAATAAEPQAAEVGAA
jgi:UDP-N-acetylmuramoyl-tripeptide--D-alanyl-D-alanine ligase